MHTPPPVRNNERALLRVIDAHLDSDATSCAVFDMQRMLGVEKCDDDPRWQAWEGAAMVEVLP